MTMLLTIGCWCRRTRSRLRRDILPSLVAVPEAIAAESFQGAWPHLERGDVDPCQWWLLAGLLRALVGAYFCLAT